MKHFLQVCLEWGLMMLSGVVALAGALFMTYLILSIFGAMFAFLGR